MGMQTIEEPIYYTREMVRALNEASRSSPTGKDGPRYETIHGELFVMTSPRPWHEVVANRLLRLLGNYLEEYRIALAFSGGAELTWGLDDVLVKPDVSVVGIEDVRTMDYDRFGDVLLVTEVLSPSTTKKDRFQKRRLYQEQGVPLLWIVDADARYAEVWTPDVHFPSVEREALRWHPEGVATPVVVAFDELFRAV